MIYMDRAKFSEPQIWKNNWKKWTRAYLKNKAKNPNYKFNFQNSKPKKKAYDELVETLLTITKQHCAFCDNWPLGNRNIKPTVEHFRPISKHPNLAYCWENLFPCCDYCQEKGKEFDKKLLKPDKVGYEFYDYFIFSETDWEMQPTKRPDISKDDKGRAQLTIDTYKLNGRPEDKGNLLKDVRIERQRIFNKFIITQNPVIDDFSFRFMFS